MSNHCCLPQEIHDYIIDLLHDAAETLKQCFLVSKSWIPRTQGRLFSHIVLDRANYPKWQKTFPDPTNSPACYARSLTVDGLLNDADWGDWIQGFSRVERLIVERRGAGDPYDPTFLLPYHRLAPSLKSLYVGVNFPLLPQTFDLIRSLPLLEDVTLRYGFITGSQLHGQQTRTGLPALTGALDICGVLGSLGRVLRSLVDFSGGLRFREVKLVCHNQVSLTPVTEPVVACSETLECFDIACDINHYGDGSVDLSKSTKLKEVVFHCRMLSSEWVSKALETITAEHKHLRQISIYVLPGTAHRPSIDHGLVVHVGKEVLGRRWSVLDHLLVQFWESRSIRSKVVWPRTKEGLGGGEDWARFLVPELTKRRVFGLVDDFGESG